MFNYEHEEKYNRGYMPIACGDGGVGHQFGAFGIILVFIFLIILFAAFRGRGGLGGFDEHVAHGRDRGYGNMADFEAIAQNIQRVPESEVQLANALGTIKEKITLSNMEVINKITETSNAAELRACMERENDFRMKMSEQCNEIQNLKNTIAINSQFGAVNAQLADIKCRMQEKTVAQPVVGLNDFSCTNMPFPRGFGDFDRNRNASCCA